MSELKQHASLRDLQEYAQAHWVERRFNNTAVQECLLLAEEVGELAKAIRKDPASGMKIDARSQVGTVAHELADVLWVVTGLANLYGIDLETAFRDKEVINHDRIWS